MTGFRLRERARRHPVAVLVAVALVLRLATLAWGVGLGRSSGWYHADESKAWSSVVGFPGNYLSNRNFLYGTALQYALGALLLPFKRLWHQGHPLVPSLTYVQFAVLAVRAVHAVLGALTVALIYRLALRLWDRPTALLAAALLAVSFYHALDSAFATLDVPMGFLVTLGLLLAARAADSPGPREFGAFGLVLGVLAGTKITGVALALVPAAMALGAPRAERARWIAGTAIAAAVAVTVFALSTPHVVLHPRAYLEFMARQEVFYVERHDHTAPAVALAWLRAMWIALTPPVAVLALVGLAAGRAAPAARRVEWGMLAFIAAQLLIWRGYFQPRFLLPVAPLLCAYAARSLVLMSRAPGATLRRAGPALTALVLALSLAAVAGGIWTRWHDPRTSAARAIARLVPAGSTVGFATTALTEPWTMHAWRYPVVDTTRHRLVAAVDGPAFLVVTGWTLEPMRQALASGRLERGYVWPDSLASFWYRYQVPAPEDFRFYARLLEGRSGYILIGCWAPATPLPPEFSDRSVGLYRRDTLPDTSRGSPPGGDPLRFTCVDHPPAWASRILGRYLVLERSEWETRGGGTNYDPVSHTTTSDVGVWDSGPTQPGRQRWRRLLPVHVQAAWHLARAGPRRSLATQGKALMAKILDEVLAANRAYAATFDDKGKLAMPPARRFAILTCMDARLDPAKFAGLAEGDAHVIRNAGGRASDDAIRSLVISYKLLGTREWFVVHHTNCGMETFTDEVIRGLLAQSLETAALDSKGWHDAGRGPGATEGEFIDWLTIRNQAESVVADVRRIRSHPLVPKTIPIYGYVYDVASGRLVEVPEATAVGRGE